MNGKYNFFGWYNSVIGPLHLQNGTPNQDYAQLYISNKITIGVVCDGLGSKKYSHIGSKTLANSLIKCAKNFDFSKDISLFKPLLKSIWDIEKYPYNDADTGTTLLFCIIQKGIIRVGMVGDGAIVLLGKGNHIITPEKNNSFGNITSSFGANSNILWYDYSVNDIDGVVMFTDGIADDLIPEKMIKFASDFIAEYKNKHIVQRKILINKWLNNWPVRGHSDDKSILALVKGER
ncbi:protein phosphatase 2C domain-containing protein [Campylobacter devanensis]|uniref:protein phosphatase 2C domain-containing protein n=1 Tax=Campylobacter devanensis TaxID=3161138 RepID=UPI0015D70980|nr:MULTISPECIES: protein phosphatase 2C domain-containing protein [unclassified Campylobacter]